MKFPRMRISVRFLMVAVAIVALCLGYFAMRQRAAIRLATAQFHAVFAAEQRTVVAHWQRGNVRLFNLTREQAEENVERSKRSAAHHDAMERKWREAARRPWLPVAPDPPEPK